MNKRTAIISLLWLIVMAALFYAMVIFVMLNNLFSWKFDTTPVNTLTIVALIVLNASLFVLSKYNREKIETLFSLLLTFAFLVFGLAVFYDFYQESIGSGFLSRSTLSPYWFRALVLVLYCFPFFVAFTKYKSKAE